MPRFRVTVEGITLALVFVLYGFNFLLFLIHAYLTVKFPYHLAAEEGLLLNQAVSLANGLGIYQDIHTAPYIVDSYPPIFPALAAVFVDMFGVSFLAGRIVSLLATMFAGYLVYCLVRDRGYRTVSLITALLFISSPYVVRWAPLHGVDMLALCFSIMGIFLVLRYQKTSKLYFAIVFFLLAGFTNQSYVAAPLAATLYLFFHNRRDALKFFALYLIGGIGAFFAVNMLTSGQFALHLLDYSRGEFVGIRCISGFFGLLEDHAIILSFALAYAIRAIRRRELSLLLFYFAFALLLSCAYGRSDSDSNYYLELILISSILMGKFIKEVFALFPTNDRTKNLATVFLIIHLCLVIQVPVLYKSTTPTVDGKKIGDFITEEIQKTDGLILAEEIGYLVINGRQIFYYPPLIGRLQRENRWDQSELLRTIQEKRFGLMIFNTDIRLFWVPNLQKGRFSREAIDAIRNNYRFTMRIGTNYLFRPANEEKATLPDPSPLADQQVHE